MLLQIEALSHLVLCLKPVSVIATFVTSNCIVDGGCKLPLASFADFFFLLFLSFSIFFEHVCFSGIVMPRATWRIRDTFYNQHSSVASQSNYVPIQRKPRQC